MSVSVKYKGTEIASASTEVTKTLQTAGKYCEADIIVENTPDGGDEPVINPLSVTENGTYTAPSGVDGYSPVTVNVQGITPTGTKNITDTSLTDVANYANAQVVDENLVAGNIKKDVSVLGVTGTFEGGGIPTKGLVFENYNAYGRPTSCRYVGTWSGILDDNYNGFFSTNKWTRSIKTLRLPDGCTSFSGGYLFQNCTSLEEFIFPSSYTSVSRNILDTCSNLRSIIFEGNVPNIPTQMSYKTYPSLYDFSHHSGNIPTLYSVESLGHASGCVIKVPQSLLTEWQTATNWADLTGVVWQGV